MSPRKSGSPYIYGIDLALRNTGVVVYNAHTRFIVHSACIQTSNEADERDLYVAEDNARCVRHIAKEIDMLMLKYPPRYAYAELPHGGGKSAKAVASMCLAAGCLVSFMYTRGYGLKSVTPYDVKRLVRKSGATDKSEVEAVVVRVFGTRFLSGFTKGKSEHIADAAGALLAGLQRDNLLKP